MDRSYSQPSTPDPIDFLDLISGIESTPPCCHTRKPNKSSDQDRPSTMNVGSPHPAFRRNARGFLHCHRESHLKLPPIFAQHGPASH
ncbi:hypothetical protein Hypma_000036 [Hypsizygus marmoreus]|uniref:Uncharacterized protein n=1 Tax=Hypsizygus marmoreus TaxID=39966 RepID=A0A369KH16_HYPMA|nr:hypothetical protein Hypma_000036 [Hypsizygus marmoreus]